MNAFVVVMTVVAVMLFPIFVSAYLYGDKDSGKVGFALYLFGAVRLLSGYAAPCKGGIAFHLTEKKAVIMPYSELLGIGKKFEVTKGFSVCNYRHCIEIGGAENMAGALAAAMSLRKLTDIVFMFARGKKDLRMEGDILVDMNRGGFRAAVKVVISFNLLIVTIAAVKIIMEKILEYGHKRKKQKSR